MEAIAKEMELRPHTEPISTIYIGGGTPSQLIPKALRLLFNTLSEYYKIERDAEITIEANPDDVTPEWISVLKETPVNRISMGVQSLNDSILKLLHRRHTAQQAQKAVELLLKADYRNLSLDLIYGLPNQTLKQFCSDVETLLNWDIPHLSAYALQYEEGTPLYALRQEGKIKEADEELSLACYESLMNLTAKAGMEHYEISNFARPGFRSRHNSSYWTGQPYIGLGAGAHSYDGDRLRSYNCEDIKGYIQSIGRSECPSTTEQLDEDARYNERVMLSLRTAEGLSLTNLERDFGKARKEYCENMAKAHIQRGSIKKTGENLCLTRRALFVSDDIISDLMV